MVLCRALLGLMLIFIMKPVWSAPSDMDTTFNSPDRGFSAGDGVGGAILAEALQLDGKILIGGKFTKYNGVPQGYLARLNADGSLDTSFNVGAGFSDWVFSIAVQGDGKILVGGLFRTYQGFARSGVVRLNNDGSLDTTFSVGTGVGGYVSSLVVEADDKILIGGVFSDYNGAAVSNIVRLNNDGSFDNTFVVNNVAGAVNAIAIDDDGKVIVAGDFTSLNGVARNHLVRLNSDGSVDAAFNVGTGANKSIYTLALQSDGGVFIGGIFTLYNGVAVGCLARLNADGSLDASFNAAGAGIGGAGVLKIALQSNGMIVVGGDFGSYNGVARKSLARLHGDGSLDLGFSVGAGVSYRVHTAVTLSSDRILIAGDFNSYDGIAAKNMALLREDGSLDVAFNANSGADNEVRSVSIQPDEKIIIGGAFVRYNNRTVNRVVRLSGDGEIDSAFDMGSGANNTVLDTALQPNGKVVLGGGFSSYNGVPANGIARLNDDGSIDVSFNSGVGAGGGMPYVYALALQPDGKIVITGSFTSYNGISRNRIARINADGSLDASFNVGTGINAEGYSLHIQKDGKILIGGPFSSYNGFSAHGLVRLNQDGSRDNSFNIGTGTTGDYFAVYDFSEVVGGKIIIAGGFTGYNGSSANGIARLNVDGSLDGSFNVGAGAFGVQSLSVQADGKVVIAGNFLNVNGIAMSRLARLNVDGSLDGTFTVGAGLNNYAWAAHIQSDGKIVVAGAFTGYKSVGRNRIARISSGDSDSDGVEDAADWFSLDPTEQYDTDHDGIGNVADLDDDADGVPDYIDGASLDATVYGERGLQLNDIYRGSAVAERVLVH